MMITHAYINIFLSAFFVNAFEQSGSAPSRAGQLIGRWLYVQTRSIYLAACSQSLSFVFESKQPAMPVTSRPHGRWSCHQTRTPFSAEKSTVFSFRNKENARGVKHKPRGPEWASHRLQSGPLEGFGKCRQGYKGWTLNCKFCSFPPDKTLTHGISY